MIIIDKIKDPTPFFTRKDKPTMFKTTLDEQKYWAKEKERWVEGYSEDVNGMLYFYATQIMLKDRITGAHYYPTVRDADVFIFNELKNCMRDGISPFIIKGRGVGLSSIGMNLPFYFFRTNPNSKAIATSRDKKTIATLFTDKTIVAYERFDPSIKFDLISKNQTANESFLRLGMKFLNNKREEEYAQSEFVCRDTQESDKATTNFSGAGAMYGFADEAPLMPRFSKFFNSARECFIDHSQNKMVGLLLNGGTVEDTIKTEDIQRINDVWNAGAILNIKPIFIPATFGKHMTNGHSDHKKAEEQILRRREELGKLDDKSDLNAYIKNNPLTIEDIFNFASNSRWEDHTRECINLQVNNLGIDKPNIGSYSLVDNNGNIEANPSDKSNIRIFEHPKENVKYVLAVDATQSTDSTSGKSGNSKFAITVMKGVDPQSDYQFCPVAVFKERPQSFDSVFNTAFRLLKYYDKFGNAKICGELNATGGVFAELITKKGLHNKHIVRRDLSKKGFVNTSKLWYYRVTATIDWQFLAANTYFKKYGHMVMFIDLLKDCQKKEEDNTDFLDSFLGCLWGFGTGDLLEEPTKEKVKSQMWVSKYVNGMFKWELKEG
jgi:hypothetical protein